MNDVQRFGPYRVLRDIGEGGMGRVSLAEREGWEEPVVLKRIHSEHAADARFRRRLLREAEVAAGLHHLNVVRVLETGVIDDQVYLSMEYVAGSSLAHVHAASRPELLPLGPILDAIAQACDGLAYVHRFVNPESGKWMELIHRDVSLDNLLLSFTGTVKIADFGIVKTSEGTQTTSGVVMGKLAYMSPEQIRDEVLDARADLYSLGVCLYELLAGRRPFPIQRGRAVMESVLYDAPPPLPSQRPGIPASLVSLVEALLAKDRKARPTEATAVAKELRAELARLGESPLFPSRLMEPPTGVPEKKPRRLRPAMPEQPSPVEPTEVMKPEVPPTLPLEPAPPLRSEAPTQALRPASPAKRFRPSEPAPSSRAPWFKWVVELISSRRRR
ncbi:protein kinase [Corallococcus macrosporus]|uniref:Protein kinase n=1 Tax=Corallococcus macrosporus TaxID=35 RepID=A0ABS3DNU7_9BACT|nr:serine/threonine-protein kinase [Corallococcus macrosporus]MBN8232943.1 protein kinase [Corallococcus macrosporus]